MCVYSNVPASRSDHTNACGDVVFLDIVDSKEVKAECCPLEILTQICIYRSHTGSGPDEERGWSTFVAASLEMIN
jgi:hypothetical protein